MNNLSQAAVECFQILRAKDYDVKLWDDTGSEVFEPEQARRMFATPENLMLVIEDRNDDSSITLYLGKSTDIHCVFGLDQSLRSCATKYNMIFHVKKEDREIEPKDFASSSVTEARSIMSNLTEGMYGTSRSSYLQLENARLIVRHSDRINETVKGARGRHVDQIFVENAQGERFLFPTQQLAPARAMVQHVNCGGSFADVVGEQIARMAQTYRNLGQASQFIYVNAANLNESAQAVRTGCRDKLHEMRRCFERLSRPTSYVEEAETLKTTEDKPLAEATVVEHLRNLLALEGRELDEGVLSTVASHVGLSGLSEAEGDAVEMVTVLGHQVSKEAWDNLRAGRIDLVGRGDGVQADYGSASEEQQQRFNAIVANVRDPSLQEFLTWVSEEMGQNSNPALTRIVRKVMGAAGASMNDGIPDSDPAVREYAEWFASRSPLRIMMAEDSEDDADAIDETDDEADDINDQVDGSLGEEADNGSVDVDADEDDDTQDLEEDLELRREDVLLPKSQSKSLKDEVTKKTTVDPDSGKEVNVDQSEMNRLMANAGLRGQSFMNNYTSAPK